MVSVSEPLLSRRCAGSHPTVVCPQVPANPHSYGARSQVRRAGRQEERVLCGPAQVPFGAPGLVA